MNEGPAGGRSPRGAFAGEENPEIDDLEAAIYDYLLLHNAKPKTFVWCKTADDIIARQRRALNAIDEIRGNR